MQLCAILPINKRISLHSNYDRTDVAAPIMMLLFKVIAQFLALHIKELHKLAKQQDSKTETACTAQGCTYVNLVNTLGKLSFCTT